MKKFRLFGTRVLLRKKEMKSGVIYIPETVRRNAMHVLAEIVAIGNGLFKGEQKKMLVEPGDTVYLQMNQLIAASCFYEERLPDGKTDALLNLEQTECIAKITDDSLTLSAWEMLGEYVLLKVRKREKKGGILLPENINPTDFIYYEVEKTSPDCCYNLKKGQEVIVVHGRAQPIRIDGEDYAYVRDLDVHGVVQGD